MKFHDKIKTYRPSRKQMRKNYQDMVDNGMIKEWQATLLWFDKPNHKSPLGRLRTFGAKIYADYAQHGSCKVIPDKDILRPGAKKIIELDYMIKFYRRSRWIKKLPTRLLRRLAIRWFLSV